MDTRLWLGQSYYSGSRLLQRVGDEIAKVVMQRPMQRRMKHSMA